VISLQMETDPTMGLCAKLGKLAADGFLIEH